MKLTEVKKKAKGLGIQPGKMKKIDLIHSIQTAENNAPCYGTSNGECSQTACCFMQDCLKAR